MSDNSDEAKLHKYVSEGKKAKLKQFLKNVPVSVDSMDNNGNTPLYNACTNEKKGIVRLLLEKGANPNERCQNGETPVHVAAGKANIKIMFMLIQYGGDLRLHDNQNRTPKTLALQQPNPARRRKMLAFIEEARSNARIHQNNADSVDHLNLCPIYPKANEERVNPCTAGFGILYKSPKEVGVTMLVPQISELDIVHDHIGPTTNNGAFMIYEAMRWRDSHPVSIKRLHANLMELGQVDLLIDELRFLRRINNFPHVLALMGICPSDNAESLMLMFERVQVGSLYNVLHEIKLNKQPRLKSIGEIALSVCDALVYLHERNIFHCYVSSHSVLLTSLHMAKLANFEYAVDRSPDPSKQRKSKIVDNHYKNCAYNWIAPELMRDEAPNEFTDVYGFCVVIWELFNMRIPWKDMEWNEIKFELINRQNQLPVEFEIIPLPFSRIIKDGFCSTPINRMPVEEIKRILDNYMSALKGPAPSSSAMWATTTGATLYDPRSQTARPQQPQKEQPQQQQQPQKHQHVHHHRSHHHHHHHHSHSQRAKLVRRDEGSYSEGIASLNEVLNSHATQNTLDDNESLSDPSTESYIYCDAYKAEFHFTPSPREVVASRRDATRTLNPMLTKRENSLDSKLRRVEYINANTVVVNNSRSKKVNCAAVAGAPGVATIVRASNVVPSSKSITDTVNETEAQLDPTITVKNGNNNNKTMDPSTSNWTQSNREAKRVQKQVSNASSQHSKRTIVSTASSASQFQQLPPTPPTAQTTTSIVGGIAGKAHQAAHVATLLGQSQHNQTLPSFLVTPSPTPISCASKSRTMAGAGLNSSPATAGLTNRSNTTSMNSPAETSTPTLKANANRVLNKFNQRSFSVQPCDDFEADQELKTIEEADLVKSTARLFEYGSGSSTSGISPGPITKTGRNLTNTLANVNTTTKVAAGNNEETVNVNSVSNTCKEFSNICDNLVRPTPDEKKRSYYPKNLTVRGVDQVDAAEKTRRLNQKLDLSVISQEDNSIETSKQNIQNETETNRSTVNSPKNSTANNVPRSGSLTRITNLFNQKSQSPQQQQQPQQRQGPKQLGARASRSETCVKGAGKGRSVSSRGSVNIDELDPKERARLLEEAQKPLNADERYCGHGSVRNLVQSYNLIPLKQRCESDHKIQQLRDERKRELNTLIEPSTVSVVASVLKQQQQQLAQASQIEQEQQQLVNIVNQQQNSNNQSQSLRKELSTISERTEFSVSPHPNLIAQNSNGNGLGNTMTGSSLGSSSHRANNSAPQSPPPQSTGSAGSPTPIEQSTPIQQSNTPAKQPSSTLNTVLPVHQKQQHTHKLTPYPKPPPHQQPHHQHHHLVPIPIEIGAEEEEAVNRVNRAIEEAAAGTEDGDLEDEDEESDVDSDDEDEEDEDGDEQDQEDIMRPMQVNDDEVEDLLYERMQALQQLHKTATSFLETTGNGEKLVELSCGDRDFTKISAINNHNNTVRNGAEAKARLGSTNNLSQEDCLSTINIGEWSNDFSDGMVIANEFDRMATRSVNGGVGGGDPQAALINKHHHHASASASPSSPTSPTTPSRRHHHQRSVLTDQSIREAHAETVMGGGYDFEHEAKAAATNLYLHQRSPHHRRSDKSYNLEEVPYYKNVAYHQQRRQNDANVSLSPGAMGQLSSTVPSYNDDRAAPNAATAANSIPSAGSPSSRQRLVGNVKIDKHVIDTSKYKGYQYKLETKSNVSNSYHIKGLLTNEQTGHSFLVTNTKVKTPNISTKVIIDQ